MNLKTFRGNSMAQALAEVKKGLGQDAVILHTRTYRVGAVFGIGGRNVVEITASDQAEAREAKRQARRPANPYGTQVSAPRATPIKPPAVPAVVPVATNRQTTSPTEPSRPIDRNVQRAALASGADSFTPSTFESVRTNQEPTIARTVKTPITPVIPVSGDEAAPMASNPVQSPQSPTSAAAPRSTARSTSPNIEVEAAGKVASGATGSSMSRLIGSPARLAPVDDLALATLQDELSSIKKMVGQVLQCSRKTAATLVPSETETRAGSTLPGAGNVTGVLNLGGMSDPLFALYMAMTESGVAAELAERLAGNVRDELSPGELADEIVVGQCMLRHLADTVRVVGSIPRVSVQADGRPLVMALVGPTGVGKTTTIAKLAATFKLRHGKKVGLITADTYRIAAVEQLRTYAEIIGLPLKVVNTPGEVASAVQSLGDNDVILLDTAGRSQHDRNRLDELAEMVEAAKPHETHLVLSSTVAEGVMRRTAERFSALAPTRVIFTKLDEAVAFGCIANIAESTKLPISFVTTGQEVPDQIELADASRLARLVLQSQGRLVGAEVGA